MNDGDSGQLDGTHEEMDGVSWGFGSIGMEDKFPSSFGCTIQIL